MEAQMELLRPLVLCVVLCCSAESSVRVSVNGGADGAGETPCFMCCCFVLLCRVFLLESQLMEAQMERERHLVICVFCFCCSAESSVRVSVNGGADGVGETPCIMCCCFVLLCRVFC